MVLCLFTTLPFLLKGNTKPAASQFNCHNNQSLKWPNNQRVQNECVFESTILSDIPKSEIQANHPAVLPPLKSASLSLPYLTTPVTTQECKQLPFICCPSKNILLDSSEKGEGDLCITLKQEATTVLKCRS